MEEKVFLKCPEKNCPLSFQKRFNLNRHYERFHMNSAIVQKCFLCGQIFENSEEKTFFEQFYVKQVKKLSVK